MSQERVVSEEGMLHDQLTIALSPLQVCNVTQLRPHNTPQGSWFFPLGNLAPHCFVFVNRKRLLLSHRLVRDAFWSISNHSVYDLERTNATLAHSMNTDCIQFARLEVRLLLLEFVGGGKHSKAQEVIAVQWLLCNHTVHITEVGVKLHIKHNSRYLQST